MSRARPAAWLSCLLVCASCGPVPDPRAVVVDLRPPGILAVRTIGPREISLEFDEEARVAAAKVRISPGLAVAEVSAPAARVLVRAEAQTPGRRYILEAEAEDARGNSCSFMADFYGFNPRVPRLLLNEFTPRGSGSHPDLAELKVLSDGDMGGLVLYEGTPGSFDDRLVFPSFEVRGGDFIIVHFKPSGDPSEVDETSDKAVSGGFDASETAFDFWAPGGQGLGGNNGVLAVYERPGGALIDGVLYSNRTSQSDERYRGFGSEDMGVRAEELVRDGGWKIAAERVTPEDAFNPEGTTGTRSICRSSGSADTDCNRDWHIVPTRGASFGADNCDDVYVPSPQAANPSRAGSAARAGP
jgi:hypothetical protein